MHLPEVTKLSFLLLFCLVFTACEDDDDVPPVADFDVPTTYEFTRGGESTVSFSGQTTRILMAEELIAAMLDPIQTEEALDNMFRNPDGVDPFDEPSLNASTKSIRSKVAASADLFSTNATLAVTVKSDFDAWIEAQVAEVFPAWNEVAAPGVPGQIADGSSVRYVNAGGFEYNQLVAKGLIGALMYDQAANHYLSPAVLDEAANRDDNDAGITAEGKPYTTMEHKWDEAFGYIFGTAANPARPLDDLGNDSFFNKYLGRVENDPDYAGIADLVDASFRRGRAAIVAGEYDERDDQAERLKSQLGRVIAIRAVYYLMQGKANLEANPIAYGPAFHDLSEGYGFIYSLQFIDGNRSGTEVYLSRLENAGGNGLWDIEPDELQDIAEDIAERFDVNLEAAAE